MILLDVGTTTETTHPMPKHSRTIPETYLELPPERRGKHSAAFLPPSSERAVSQDDAPKAKRIPKHSKAFADASNPTLSHTATGEQTAAAQHCRQRVDEHTTEKVRARTQTGSLHQNAEKERFLHQKRAETSTFSVDTPDKGVGRFSREPITWGNVNGSSQVGEKSAPGTHTTQHFDEKNAIFGEIDAKIRSHHSEKAKTSVLSSITRWAKTTQRQVRANPPAQWIKIAGASVCGLALLGGIGGVGFAIHNTLDANWALTANADDADNELVADQNFGENSEVTSEDTSSLEATSDTSLSIEERLALVSSQTLQNTELGSLPTDQDPFAFIASTSEVFSLSTDSQSQLASAVEPFASAGYSAGYLLVDVESGRGIAANLDQQVYGASAIKAPFILYMLETAFPSGTVNFDTPFSEDLAWDSMDGDLTLDSESLYPFMTLAESSITSSDNDAFRIIRANYETPDFRTWLDNLNLQNVDASEWFPYLSARDLGKLWLEMYTFWETETEEAWWLETHCSLTEMSFVRAALMGQGLYPDIVVADKAGWINGWDPGYHCLTDGALVTYNGRTYLLCAVTDAPYDEYWESCFEALIANVFAAREELA